MSEPAFIDSNIPLYASGGLDPLREPCGRILRDAATRAQTCWASAEVLQEVLHVTSRRRQDERGRRTIRGLVAILRERVVAVDATHITWCLTRDFPGGLDARDRVHLSVMNRLGIGHIISADKGFDSVPGITRLDPADFDSWRELVFG